MFDPAVPPPLASIDDPPLPVLGVVLAVLAVLLVGLPALYAHVYRKVDQGQALIINKARQLDVSFTGGLVLPVIHRAEVMDISVKPITLSRKGHEGLVCRDDIRADIEVTFFVRVNPTAQDVLEVARSIGTARASDPKTLDRLFRAKFFEALQTVGKRMDFESLYTHRHEFKHQIVEVIGDKLSGYVLDDVAIDYLEQTPMEAMDPNNVLDARGIHKLTALTAEQAVLTNGLRRDATVELRHTDVQAKEVVLQLDRQQAAAEAVKARGVASTRAREHAQTVVAQAAAAAQMAYARIERDREITFGNGKRKRLTALAEQARVRAVALEQEQAMRQQQLAALDRALQTEHAAIAQQAARERARAEVARAARARVVAQHDVVQEQERIANVRVRAAAQRAGRARVVGAEAAAEAALVEDVKRAEARQHAAAHTARASVTRAQAQLTAADRYTRAMLHRAQGVQAERAATGLARVEVLTADATAIEAAGLAEAGATRALMMAEASGRTAQGLADVRVAKAEAEAIAQQGLARAEARRAYLLAVATGTKQQGLAEVEVKGADALATEAMGRANASALRQAMFAEAEGLAQRAEALRKLGPQARAHERFRFAIDKLVQVQSKAIEVSRDIAVARAEVLAPALRQTQLTVVGV